ncbi:MAG: PAS domain-containing protein, partial [Nitrospira sp.]|nr:PAS domain-containing protein [Nitrospira sp.]
MRPRASAASSFSTAAPSRRSSTSSCRSSIPKGLGRRRCASVRRQRSSSPAAGQALLTTTHLSRRARRDGIEPPKPSPHIPRARRSAPLRCRARCTSNPTPDSAPTRCHGRLLAGSIRETDEIVLIIEDLTALTRTEQERNRLTKDLLLLLESTGEGIFGVDTSMRCTFMNKAGAAMLGHEPVETLGRNMHELIHHSRPDGSSYPAADCPIVRACRDGTQGRLNRDVLWRRDGTSFEAEYSAYPIVENERITGAVVTFSDITKHRRTERAFHSLVEGTAGAVGERFFRSLVEQLAGALGVRYAMVCEFTSEARDRVRTLAVWGGTGFLDDFEYALAGTPCEALLDAGQGFHPQDLCRRFPAAEAPAKLGAASYLGAGLRDAAGRVLGLLVVMDTAPMIEEEFSLSLLKIFGARAAAELERKQAEEALRASEAQLRQAQKMEAVGQLAGGIAHDFNNLLMVITGYSANLLRVLDPDSPLRRYPAEIQKAGDRAAALIQQLLAFSRRQEIAPTVINLNEIVTAMYNLLHRLIGEHIELVLTLDPHLACVKADQGQIEQIIMNLVVNARDAMPTGG